MCKHVALVILKCDPNVSNLYFGNAKLTKKDENNLKLILSTFNSSRKVQNTHIYAQNRSQRKEKSNTNDDTKKKLTKMSTLQIPVKGPFLSKDLGLDAAPENKWYVEKYSVGGHPKCRTCSKPIRNLDLCIRTDAAYCIILPTSVEKTWSLRCEIIRFCLNDTCHRNLPKSKQRFMKILPMRNICLDFISSEEKKKIGNILSVCQDKLH